MRWVQVNNAHFNTNLICSFHWTGGKLWVWFIGEESAERYEDPQRKNYIRLCRALGVAPIGGDSGGES